MSVKIRPALYDFHTFPPQPFPVNVRLNWTVFFERVWHNFSLQLRVKTRGAVSSRRVIFSFHIPDLLREGTTRPPHFKLTRFLCVTNHSVQYLRVYLLVLKNTVLGVAQLLHSDESIVAITKGDLQVKLGDPRIICLPGKQNYSSCRVRCGDRIPPADYDPPSPSSPPFGAYYKSFDSIFARIF